MSRIGFVCLGTWRRGARIRICGSVSFQISRHPLSAPRIGFQRSYSSGVTFGGTKKMLDRDDEGTKEAHVVYQGSLTTQLKRVKLFSLTTSAIGLYLQPMIYSNLDQNGKAATAALLATVGFFTFGTPFLIHQLAKKYVTEIVYDPKTKAYTAVMYGFFLTRKEVKFRKDDVIVPDVPGPFTTVLVKAEGSSRIPIFFGMEAFTVPKHYALLMGYDKPLDLKLTAQDVEEAVQRKLKDNN